MKQTLVPLPLLLHLYGPASFTFQNRWKLPTGQNAVTSIQRALGSTGHRPLVFFAALKRARRFLWFRGEGTGRACSQGKAPSKVQVAPAPGRTQEG